MKSPDGGLVAAVYAPCEVTTRVKDVPMHIKVETEYPFRESVKASVSPQKPLQCLIQFRIPGWAHGATLRVNGKTAGTVVNPGTYAKIDRLWSPGDVVELHFPAPPRVSRWVADSVAVERGPLVFSLDLKGNWLKLRDRGPTADWQVYPGREWNYALAVTPEDAATLKVVEHPLGARPFAASEAPLQLAVPARRLNEWLSEDGVANPVPPSPVTSREAEETLMLIPYGAAKLRITAFPQLKT